MEDKNTKNPKKEKDNKDNKSRKIKQVEILEDGREEVKSTIDLPREEAAEEIIEQHHAHAENHTLRVVAVAAAMLVSIVLSMAVGVGLALWDSGRTFGQLTTIVFAREEVSPAIQEEVTADANTAGDPDALDEVPDDGKAAQEDVPDEADEEEDYGSTIASDTEGLTKAGSGDEIETADEEVPDVLDPMADYPRPFTKVDESYFTDALFIGDSRLQGFGFWSGLPATYYCATGFALYKYDTTKVVQTENGKVPIFDAMPYDAFTKIYIKVGLNELGYGTEENFENKYAELIAKLREYEPRAIIYVHAILPVTAAKSSSDKAHNNPNILVRNASLEKFAKEQKAYFLDAGPVLSDEDGNLRPEMTSDGIHLKPEYMKIWREYLCEHAVEVN